MVKCLKHQGTQASEDYLRWRPSFHLTAPHGWLNDPCGLGYDPLTGQYHLSFQWNPNGNDWGDISWGHSTSYDFISWKTSPYPCLTPSAPYDQCGVFTGCLQPTSIDGKQNGTLTYIYTSVNRLPIHYTMPYNPGSESLSIAVSRDGGSSWEKVPGNPILPGPPPDIKVTAWRDPFVASWPSGRQVVHSPPNEPLYGFVSGGITGQTPTVFVYSINPNDLTEWKYVGHLLDVGLNCCPSRWSGDSGVNWEVANIMTLKDGRGALRDFIIMGTEGCLPQDESAIPFRNVQAVARGRRIRRSQLWMCTMHTNFSSLHCAPSQRSPIHQPLVERAFGGFFDHGCYYAANSFWDPVTSEQIVFGWITEEDLPKELRHHQNWSGVISLPRVVKLTTLTKVKRARSSSDLGSITSIEVTPDGEGQETYTIRTLGIFPDQRLEGLRTKAHRMHLPRMTRLRQLQRRIAHERVGNSPGFLRLNTLRWELKAEIAIGKRCSGVGLAIGHDPDFHFTTVLYWDPISETFIIERPRTPFSETDLDDNGIASSKSQDAVNHAPEVAPHTLFTFATTTSTKRKHETSEASGTNLVHEEAADLAAEVEEPLRIHAFYDVSVLEVFVNERTVISTRIYPLYSNNVGADRCYGIQFFAQSVQEEETDGEVPAVLQSAFVWDGLDA